MVPLDAVNRRLVEAGLRRMRDGKACAGVNALFEVAKRDVTRATAYDLGFMLGPRVNAAGRLDDISLGIECLTTDDPPVPPKLLANLTASTANVRASNPACATRRTA